MVSLKKNVKNSVKCVKVGNDMFANNVLYMICSITHNARGYGIFI